MNEQQKRIIQTALVMGAFAYGSATKSKALRYALMGFIGMQVYRLWKQNGGTLVGTAAEGWGVKFDSDLAIDMLMPATPDDLKAYAKMVGREVMEAVKQEKLKQFAGGGV